MSENTISYNPNTAVNIEVFGFTGVTVRSASNPVTVDTRMPVMIKFSRMIGSWVADFQGNNILIKEGKFSTSSERLTVSFSGNTDITVRSTGAPGEQVLKFNRVTSIVIIGKNACRIEVNNAQNTANRPSPLPVNNEVQRQPRTSPLPVNNEVQRQSRPSPLPVNNEVRQVQRFSPLPVNDEVHRAQGASPLGAMEQGGMSAQGVSSSQGGTAAQDREITRLRTELAQKDKEIEKLRNDITDSLEKLADAKGAELMSLNTRQLAAIEKIKENNIAIEKAEQSLTETQKKVDAVQRDLDAKNAQLAELGSKAEVMSLDCEKAMTAINEIRAHAKLDKETAELLEDGVELKKGTVTDTITELEKELDKVDEKIALIIRLKANYNTDLQNTIDTGSGELTNKQETGGQ